MHIIYIHTYISVYDLFWILYIYIYTDLYILVCLHIHNYTYIYIYWYTASTRRHGFVSVATSSAPAWDPAIGLGIYHFVSWDIMVKQWWKNGISSAVESCWDSMGCIRGIDCPMRMAHRDDDQWWLSTASWGFKIATRDLTHEFSWTKAYVQIWVYEFIFFQCVAKMLGIPFFQNWTKWMFTGSTGIPWPFDGFSPLFPVYFP